MSVDSDERGGDVSGLIEWISLLTSKFCHITSIAGASQLCPMVYLYSHHRKSRTAQTYGPAILWSSESF
jgi:hypothetical protein